MRCVSLFTLAINHLTFSRGDLTAQPGGTPLKMAYDGEGKMSAACTNESGNCTDSPAINRTLYRYDALGQRVEKLTGDGTITRYLYDAGQLAAEYTNAPVTDLGRRYLTTDHLGTTRVITDPTGTILTRRDYFPFGEEISPATLAAGNLRSTVSAYGDNTISLTTVRFTEKERDAETGLDYFGARYMSAAQGRFTTPDWSSIQQPVPHASLSNPQTLNLYVYLTDNPVGGIDLDGHGFWQKFKNFFGSAGCWCEGEEAERRIEQHALALASALHPGPAGRQERVEFFVTFAYESFVEGIAESTAEETSTGGESQEVAIATNQVIQQMSKIPMIRGRRPINSKYAGRTHPSGIPFTDQGFPDFGAVAEVEVTVQGLTGDYKMDSAKANAAAGLSHTPQGYTWHPVEDGVTMQLVPKEPHQDTRHTGGAAVIKNGGFDKP